MSTTATPPPPPLVSSSPANQATSGASNTAAAAFVVILVWALGAMKLTVPPEVTAALTALIGMGVHYAVVTYGMKNTVG